MGKFKVIIYFRRLALSLLSIAASSLLLVCFAQAADANSPASMMIDGIEIQDPTRPLDWRAGPKAKTRQSAERPKLSISSILISPARRLAIINGRSVAEGDTIEGVKVQRVSADGVQLRWQGEQWTARLSKAGSTVRQPVRTMP